jgi:hypothetical protein
MKIHRKPLSRFFPAYHPKAGQPTFFVEKLWFALYGCGYFSLSKLCELSKETGIGNFNTDNIRKVSFEPKYHTIRAGHKVNAGDFIQFYSWIGKPYGKGSTTINIAPPIEVKKTWDFEIKDGLFFIDNELFAYCESTELLNKLAANDGLAPGNVDMLNWFKYPKNSGECQIICWNDSINY